jgi:hypothetical protein
MDQIADPDTPLPRRIVCAAVLVGLLTATGCAPSGVDSIDLAERPDLNKISAAPKAEPKPRARTQPVRKASKKAAPTIGG